MTPAIRNDAVRDLRELHDTQVMDAQELELARFADENHVLRATVELVSAERDRLRDDLLEIDRSLTRARRENAFVWGELERLRDVILAGDLGAMAAEALTIREARAADRAEFGEGL